MLFATHLGDQPIFVDPTERLLQLLETEERHARANPLDKRAVPLLYDNIFHEDPRVRLVVARMIGIRGYIDGLVDSCVRTDLAKRLLAMAQSEPSEQNRVTQRASAELLQELGLVNTSPAAIERCRTTGAIERGLAALRALPGSGFDPEAKVPQRPGRSLSTGEKAAVGVATVAVLALGTYVVAGARRRRARARRRAQPA